MSILNESNSYSWNPNYFQIKDPDTGRYLGNVIGNLSKEDQLEIVRNAGTDKKNQIREVGQEHLSEITQSSEKFVRLMGISNDAMREIVLFFGGIFVLDSSALDGTPLG